MCASESRKKKPSIKIHKLKKNNKLVSFLIDFNAIQFVLFYFVLFLFCVLKFRVWIGDAIHGDILLQS